MNPVNYVALCLWALCESFMWSWNVTHSIWKNHSKNHFTALVCLVMECDCNALFLNVFACSQSSTLWCWFLIKLFPYSVYVKHQHQLAPHLQVGFLWLNRQGKCTRQVLYIYVKKNVLEYLISLVVDRSDWRWGSDRLCKMFRVLQYLLQHCAVSLKGLILWYWLQLFI